MYVPCPENGQERQTRTGTSSRATRDVTTTRKTILKDRKTGVHVVFFKSYLFPVCIDVRVTLCR